ncbi:GNAT family N-acetyltransferase [Nocardioides cavernaquae]|uniref:GNAT family N-acetyltransferase n=1 Tax=Nocardioides cavernaquae TaxID=2321396 RepID=A0A3A5HC03_9ACTN|nr:GNAT family N-acetyltransferase [Nocardioides cavernaquae]RJS47651.1 GNAT family N-acetyltransferase [Nocardioides cavernaquae]
MSADPDLMLRPAVADDVPLLVQVMRAAREAAPMPDLPYADREVGAHLAARLSMDETWVADDGDGPVGFARLTGTWLDDLYVVPEAQRSGVGSSLLDLAKALRPDGFGLWVFSSNVPARAFYARHGLLELESTDGRANDEGAPDLRMVWAGEQPLSYLRAQIDEVDDELAALLARRTALTAAVQEIKPVGGPAGRDPEREQQIAERIAPMVPLLPPEAVQRIVHTIIEASLDAAATPGRD